MWYKIKELIEKGSRQSQICRETGLDKKTVRRYQKMSYEEFTISSVYKRMYTKLLDPYEEEIRQWLEGHNDLSSSQIHDWLRERHSDIPEVNIKTVFNFVEYIRSSMGYQSQRLPIHANILVVKRHIMANMHRWILERCG